MDDVLPDNPLVSIVIPTYNAESYILEAIESVLSQTYSSIELIIVDDGSTDNTAELLKQTPGNFKYYYQQNAGQSAAMNFGWKQSSGQIMGYLSADDRLHAGAVDTIVKKMLDHPEVVLAYPDFCIIDENSTHIRNVETPDYNQKLLIANFHCIPGPGALFKREAWLAAGDWSTKLRNIPDMDFFLRLCKQGDFLRVKPFLADFRIHSGSTTYSPTTAERADEPVRVVNDFFAQHDTSGQLRNWQKSSTANALMLSGFMHGYSRRYYKFICRVTKAVMISPSAVISRKMAGYVYRIFKKQTTQ